MAENQSWASSIFSWFMPPKSQLRNEAPVQTYGNPSVANKSHPQGTDLGTAKGIDAQPLTLGSEYLDFSENLDVSSPISYSDIPSEQSNSSLGVPIVTTADATHFPEPEGTKVAPGIIGGNLMPVAFYPVLRWGDCTYWPLSYWDNRMSFAIVVTDQEKRVLRTIQLKGSRYIQEIRVYPGSREVSFIGQSNLTATISWEQLYVSPSSLPPPRYRGAQPTPAAQLGPASPPPRYTKNSDQLFPTPLLPPLQPSVKSATRRPIPPIKTPDQNLDAYFSPPRTTYTIAEFDIISRLLASTEWATFKDNPRLYTLLRALELLSDLELLLSKGISDSSLPLSIRQLPSNFSEEWKGQFIAAQYMVCNHSDAEVLQLVENRKHINFTQPPNCFVRQRFIGRGGRGEVDEVECSLFGDYKVYARKRIFRQNTAVIDTDTVKAFAKEIETMKRINHHHCVTFVSASRSIVS
ncbi:hypothetical protein TWF694_011582 [Orbilia ellipsospora]|uniref:Protein kinase domain-containing protein n=1 Tax=Orbilia ellipsospora TaxID=2528407 RepID=A0AAV9X5M0_9PEZI